MRRDGGKSKMNGGAHLGLIILILIQVLLGFGLPGEVVATGASTQPFIQTTEGGVPPTAQRWLAAAIVLTDSADPAIRFGMTKLQEALAKHGVSVSVYAVADEVREPVVFRFATGQTAEGLGPESFSIRKRWSADRLLVEVAGSDTTGTMYAILELAERVRWLEPPHDDALTVALNRAIRNETKQPFLAVRGVNQFIHKQALDDENSWFFSAAFWRAYLDMLALTRHNFLDLHGLYDLDRTDFPDLLPYFVWSESHPNPTASQGQAARNLAMLRQITEMANERGIRVGIMTYSPSPLAEFNKTAVAELLQKLPRLWAFGFRIGESGTPAPIIQSSYLEGFKASGSHVNFYTRSWLASRTDVLDMSKQFATGQNEAFVEIKYNGEQLGLPYQVQGERSTQWGSHTFQDYTSQPRPYSIIWQVRANGTHRVFQWGDPEFARRVARSAKFGEAKGITTEPHTAYYPMTDYLLNQESFGRQPYFNWSFQRSWFWYEVFGRTSFDPDVSDTVFSNLFRDRFGDVSGPSLHQATVSASRILPVLYAYHAISPDHRNMAPELETGSGHRRVGPEEIAHEDFTNFLGILPLDDSVMASPREYVDELIASRPTGRAGPLWAAAELEEAIAQTAQALKQVGTASPADAPMLADLVMDLEELMHLGRYYSHKFRAALGTEVFLATCDNLYARQARDDLIQANNAWYNLAASTARHFRPFPERLRMHTAAFTWEQEGNDLHKDVAWLESLSSASCTPRTTDGAALVSALSRADTSSDIALSLMIPDPRNAKAAITAAVADPDGIDRVWVEYKPMPSFYRWQTQPMHPSGDSRWEAEVPLTPDGLLYRIVAIDKSGNGTRYPDFRKEQPYRWILPWPAGWIDHGFLSLPEGVQTYSIDIGAKPFSDQDVTITAVPPDLRGLFSARLNQGVMLNKQLRQGGGFSLHVRPHQVTRAFVAFMDPVTEPGWTPFAVGGVQLDGRAYDIYARDLDPGEHQISFRRGTGVILGFKPLSCGDGSLERPFVRTDSGLNYQAVKLDFLTVESPWWIGRAQKDRQPWQDRGYVMVNIPQKAQGALGIQFPVDLVKTQGVRIPFKLDRPARLYVVFAAPEDSIWGTPDEDWKLLCDACYQHVSDDRHRPVYYKDYQSGDHTYAIPRRRIVVILGFVSHE